MTLTLFQALLSRWKRHYFGKRARWQDRALFRSLNMAFQAASLPAGVGANIFDLGRSVSLWVSAFEILSHPRVSKADLFTVYPLFERVVYCERKVGRRQYAAYIPQWKKIRTKRRVLVNQDGHCHVGYMVNYFRHAIFFSTVIG
jgi:hypothetical protein